MSLGKITDTWITFHHKAQNTMTLRLIKISQWDFDVKQKQIEAFLAFAIFFSYSL